MQMNSRSVLFKYEWCFNDMINKNMGADAVSPIDFVTDFATRG